MLADTKILARDESIMHGRGLATSANMTQTVCDTIFLHSCAMQRWNPSSDAPPVPPSAAAVDVVRGGDKDEFIGSQLALNRKGFYAALCRVAAHMRATDPLPDAIADLLRCVTLRRHLAHLLLFMTHFKATTYCLVLATWTASRSSGATRRTESNCSGRTPLEMSGQTIQTRDHPNHILNPCNRPLSPWTRLLDRGQDGAGVLLTTRKSESNPILGAADAANEDALSQTRPQPQYVHVKV
jgi:hypothetical protein